MKYETSACNEAVALICLGWVLTGNHMNDDGSVVFELEGPRDESIAKMHREKAKSLNIQVNASAWVTAYRTLRQVIKQRKSESRSDTNGK